MLRYPVNLASSLGSTLRVIPKRQQRINRSTMFTLVTKYAQCVEVRQGTDENEETVCVLLPAMGHFVIFLL